MPRTCAWLILALCLPACGAGSGHETKPSGSGQVDPATLNDFQRGEQAIKNESYQEAVAHFDRAIVDEPDNAEAHYYRALAHDQLGKGAEARQGYQRAIELDAALAAPRVNLGAMLLEQNPPAAAEAAEVLEPAVQAEDAAADVRENLAFAYRLLKRNDDAVAQYEKAIASEDSARIRFALADLLWEIGRQEAAVPHLSKALAGFAQDEERVVVIAHRLGKAKAYADCVEAFDAAVGLNDHEPGYLLHRGLCKHGLKNEKEARADYRAATKLELTFQPAFFYLGMSYLGEGMKDEARSALGQAVKLGKDTPVGREAVKRLRSLK